MPDEDVINKDASQGAKEETKPSSKENILFGLLMHFLTFLGGVLFAALWLKFVSCRRFEVEWGMDCFRDPKILIAMTSFFFLMGMGLVYGLRHMIAWLMECRTYE